MLRGPSDQSLKCHAHERFVGDVREDECPVLAGIAWLNQPEKPAGESSKVAHLRKLEKQTEAQSHESTITILARERLTLGGGSDVGVPIHSSSSCDGSYLRFIVWAGTGPSAGLASPAGVFIAFTGFVAVIAAAAGVIVACTEFVRSGD
jgi:hypothetical protein